MPARPAVAAVLALAACAGLALSLGGCHCTTPARFWKATDRATGAVAYTVDTVETPLGTRLDAVYLDPQGHEVPLGDTDLAPMTEAEWRAATGGASWQHAWCPKLQSCWALPVAR